MKYLLLIALLASAPISADVIRCAISGEIIQPSIDQRRAYKNVGWKPFKEDPRYMYRDLTTAEQSAFPAFKVNVRHLKRGDGFFHWDTTNSIGEKITLYFNIALSYYKSVNPLLPEKVSYGDCYED